MVLKLRFATEADAEQLLEWRNDPLSRRNARNTGIISWSTHTEWLRESLASASRKVFVAEKDNRAVGTCRLDYSDSSCELSWIVAPEHRGQGIGKAMVQLLIEQAGSPTLIAEIRVENEPSMRIARGLTFAITGYRNGFGVWKLSK
jgi:RimJ/RimL family protein N-acetyltransferase